MLIALIIADLLMVAAFGIQFTKLPPQIPLFYSQLWGESQLADLWYIALIPIFLHVLVFLNSYIYRRFFWQDHTVKNIIKYMNFIVIGSFTAIFLKIVFLIS